MMISEVRRNLCGDTQGVAMSLHVSISLILDQEMDGKAVCAGLATCPGPDWLKDVVLKVGFRLKIHNALRTLYNQVS